jgi:hypothetical protein
MSRLLHFDRPRPSPTPQLEPHAAAAAGARRDLRILISSAELLAVHRPTALKTMAAWAVRLAAPIQAGTWNPDTTKGGA